MAADGASEITPEQVIAAIGDRSQKIEVLDAKLAAGPQEQQMARLRMLKAAISAELSDLTIVLEAVRRGDLASMDEITPGRLDELLAARTDRVARLRGVPLEKRLELESAARAFRLAIGMHKRATAPRAVMAAPGAPPSTRCLAAATREDLARLQI